MGAPCWPAWPRLEAFVDGGKCDELLDVRKRTAMPDWPALMPDVAVALLGEPSSRTGRELRYGRRGSLSVDLAGGRWFDHEAGEGGGVVELVTREHGGDTAAAMAWLESAGFVEPQSGQHAVRGSVSRSEAVSPPVATAAPPDANTQERAALSPWCEASEIRAAGGTSGIDANAATDPDAARPIVLYPDGDPSGRVRMTRAPVALQAAGRIVEIECCAPGEDPATVLADELAERAAIREFEGGADCDDADHGAWTDFFEKEKNR